MPFGLTTGEAILVIKSMVAGGAFGSRALADGCKSGFSSIEANLLAWFLDAKPLMGFLTLSVDYCEFCRYSKWRDCTCCFMLWVSMEPDGFISLMGFFSIDKP